MFCKKCDNYLEEGTTICDKCGTVNDSNFMSVTQNNGEVNTINFNLNENSKQQDKKYIASIEEPEKKNNKTLFIIISIVCIFIIALGIIIGKNLLSKDDKKIISPNNADNILLKEEENRITLSKFTFNLPSNLQYSNEKNYIYAANKDISVTLKMNIIETTYEQIKRNYNNLVKEIETTGTQVIDYNTTKKDGLEYFVFAIVQGNTERLYALRELDSTHIVQAVIQTTSSKGYEEALGYINQIVSSYEKVEAYLGTTESEEAEDVLSDEEVLKNNNIGELFEIEEEN